MIYCKHIHWLTLKWITEPFSISLPDINYNTTLGLVLQILLIKNNKKSDRTTHTVTARDVTFQCWDGLQKLWALRSEESASVEHNKQVAESERYMFRVLCYRAEAVSIIQSLRDKLH